MATYDHYFYRKSPGSSTTGSIFINVTASSGTFSRATGSFVTDGFVAGHTINVSGFSIPGNNNPRIIQTVTATTITVVDSTGLVNEAGNGNEVIQIGWSPNIINNIFNFSISREVGNEISRLTFELVYTHAISQYDMIRIRKDGNADTNNIFVGAVTNVQTNGNKKLVTVYDMLIYAKWSEYNPSTQPGSITTKQAFINLCSAAGLSDNIDVTATTNGDIDWTFSHANVFEKMQKVAQITTSAGPVGWQFYHDPLQLNGGAYNKIKFAPRATASETNYYYSYTGQTTNIKDVSFTENGDDIINDVTVIGGEKTSTILEPGPTTTNYWTADTGQTAFPSATGKLKYYPADLDNGSNGVYVYDNTNPEVKKTINVDYAIVRYDNGYQVKFYSAIPMGWKVRIAYSYTSSPEKSASDTTSKNTYGTRKKTIYRSDITDETVIQNLANAIIASISASGFKDPVDEVTFKTSPTTSDTLGGKANVYDGLHNITKTGLTTYSITYSYPEGMNTVTCSNRPIRNPITQLALESRVKRNEEYIASATESSSSYATNPMGKNLDMSGWQITNARIHNSATNPANLGIGGIYYDTDDHKIYYNKNGTWTEISGGGSATWGSITGTLSNQTDLQNALNAKLNLSGGTLTGDLIINKADPVMIIGTTSASSPVLGFRDSSGNIDAQLYTTLGNDTVLASTYGGLYLATADVNGGNIYLQTKAVTRLTIADSQITAAVPLAMSGNQITSTKTDAAPISLALNSPICTNLNADKLDGYHASSFLTNPSNADLNINVVNSGIFLNDGAGTNTYGSLVTSHTIPDQNFVISSRSGDLHLETGVTSKAVYIRTNSVPRLTIADSAITAAVPLNMSSQKITGLGAHGAVGDAVRYEHLAADEHTQYLNTSRHDTTARHGASVVDHGSIGGLADDDHTQYYNTTRHTKAVHDDLNINADTLDTYHASSFLFLSGGTLTGDLAMDKVAPTINFYNSTVLKGSIQGNASLFVITPSGVPLQLGSSTQPVNMVCTELAMGSKKITGLATATNPSDAVRLDQTITNPLTSHIYGGGGAYGLLDISNIWFWSTATMAINQSASGNPGNSLTVRAGHSGTGTNLAGGDVTISSGQSTGSGYSQVFLKAATPGGSGSTVRTPSTYMTIGLGSIQSHVWLDMTNNKIRYLAAPESAGDAVRYEHLAADEHTQYLLINGTRIMTGDLTIDKNGPTISLNDTTSPGGASQNIRFRYNGSTMVGIFQFQKELFVAVKNSKATPTIDDVISITNTTDTSDDGRLNLHGPNSGTKTYLRTVSGDMELHVPSGGKVKIVVG